jgi:transcriptional regulator with XRE-family HTH domain
MGTQVDPFTKPKLSLPTVLAANVQRMRKSKDWSQEELARRSWLTRETIRSVERGDTDVRLSTVEQLALALGVAAVALLRESRAISIGKR